MRANVFDGTAEAVRCADEEYADITRRFVEDEFYPLCKKNVKGACGGGNTKTTTKYRRPFIFAAFPRCSQPSLRSSRNAERGPFSALARPKRKLKAAALVAKLR